jgi:Glycosyltransferase family 87
VTDFRIFMTGVSMVASGQGHQLYHFDAQEKAQVHLYPETRTSGLLPYNHPAYELLFYWPVSGFSHRTALLVWAVANVGILFLIAWLLAPYTRTLEQVTGTPLALCLLAFYPVIYVLGEGQDSLLFMLALVLSLRAMDGGYTFLAGYLLALACFKFHLVLIIAFFVLFLRGKWRGLAGFISGGAVIGGVSLALVGPAMVHDYPAMLRRQESMTPWGFVPWFMPNLRGVLQWALAP